jgi:hypothetical protein
VPPLKDDPSSITKPPRSRARPRSSGNAWVIGLSIALVAALAVAGVAVLRPRMLLHVPGLAPPPASQGASPGASPGASLGGRPHPFDIVTADEAAILAAHPASLAVFRYQDAPAVLVLSFPTLHEQARMFDRIGAFVEKTGLPHDRVLDEADLQAAIRLSGDTEDTYYYGHDYRAADLARFFALADRDGVALHPEEETLRRLLTQVGFLVPGAVGAVISIPPESVVPPIDATARATILHHELSHGIYFTDPAYAAYARNFWQSVLTEAQRTGFRRFLGSEGYDMTNEDLMLNETQAYLIHTPDPRYFRPELAGLTDAEAARLRQIFFSGMPIAALRAGAQRGP